MIRKVINKYRVYKNNALGHTSDVAHERLVCHRIAYPFMYGIFVDLDSKDDV